MKETWTVEVILTIILTLPVRRYLVPTPYTKGVGGGGGGGQADVPMISKTVDFTNFNFGRHLGISMRDKNQ